MAVPQTLSTRRCSSRTETKNAHIPANLSIPSMDGDSGPSDLEFPPAHSPAASYASALSFMPFGKALVPYSWTRCT